MSDMDRDRIQELQAVVAELGNTLAAGERRTVRLERIVRYGVIGVAASLGLAALVNLNPLGYAVAQQEMPQSASVEQAIDRLNQNLSMGLGGFKQKAEQVMGMMELAMMAAVEEIKDQEKQDAALWDRLQTKRKQDPNMSADDVIREYEIVRSPLAFYAQSYTLQLCGLNQWKMLEQQLTEQEIQIYCDNFTKYLYKLPEKFELPSVEEQNTFDKAQTVFYQAALVASVGKAFTDAGALLTRVRQDSDFVREQVGHAGGPQVLLGGITKQLEVMNMAMQSIPIMAAEMDAMNRQMSVMSYSVGNTMGRVGDWMPW